METSFLKRISLLLLVIVYNYFFWGEGLGLNLFIFNSLLFTSLYFIYKENFNSKKVLLPVVCTFILSALVVYNNSLFSKIVFFVFLVTSLGYVHQAQVRSIWAAVITGILSLFMFPYTFVMEGRQLSGKASGLPAMLRKVKLVMIPLLILIVFYIIYINANPIFAEASGYVWDKADRYFFQFFLDFPFARSMFVILGIAIVCGFIYNWNIENVAQAEGRFSDKLFRKYNPFGRYRGEFKTLSLLNENRSAVILLVMINALIAVLNFIDIRYVWFGFEYHYGFDIRQFVHEGTYYLIFSIILSMAIMLFYFRGNLNFYTGNVWMKRLAYLWIIQNGIMAVSVAIRNFYYIHYSHILAYKRIGLILFLIMVFIGLVTLYLKIKNKQTFYHLVKINFVSVYSVLFISCFFNWGTIIAEYNLSNPNKDMIEYEYNVNLSDETLPILYKNKNLLDRELTFYEFLRTKKENGLEYFKKRKYEFMEEYRSGSWLSWNYADWETYTYFKEHED